MLTTILLSTCAALYFHAYLLFCLTILGMLGWAIIDYKQIERQKRDDQQTPC